MKKKTIQIEIGIFVHNEEKNIQTLLSSLWKQKTEVAKIRKILVVSSGSFDKTNEYVRKEMRKHQKLSLVTELERKGKSASINTFLEKTTSPIVVSVSGDLRLHSRAIEEIVLPFLDDRVGMVGAHPIPKKTNTSTIQKEIEILWDLHHMMSLREAKCGEMVAFRNVVRQIPKNSAVDEATLEVMLKILGYTIVYAPRSIVYNKGPKNWKEFFIQRRRVYAGHQWIESTYNHTVSTMKEDKIFSILFDYALHNPENIFPLVRLMLMEGAARFLGFIDYQILRKNPYKWKMISR